MGGGCLKNLESKSISDGFMFDYYFCPVLNFGKKGTFFSCRPRWDSNQLQHGSLADSESGHMNQIDMMLPA